MIDDPADQGGPDAHRGARTGPMGPERDRDPMIPDGPRGSRWASLPNRLTRLRLATIPLLWILAILRESTWLGVGLMLAALTDVADGAIARHYHRTTPLGSRLDSIADHMLTVSTALWLVWLRPDFVAEQLPLLSTWLALGLAALLVGWVRFRRIGDLHLYSAKVAGTLGYLFAVWLLLFGTYDATVFYLVIAICMLASAESLLVVSTRSEVDEHVGSILSPPRPRDTR
jgi:cardiolipin synthase